MFHSKMDATPTGHSYQAYGELFPVLNSEYADNTATIFKSYANVSEGVSSIILHLTHFGTEIHTRLTHPTRDFKTEIRFCSKPLFMYDNPETFDDADLSDVTVDEQSYIPIVNHFQYLGSLPTEELTDNCINARILKAGNAFGSIQKLFFNLSMCMTMLKSLFMSQPYYLFYYMVTNLGV